MMIWTRAYTYKMLVNVGKIHSIPTSLEALCVNVNFSHVHKTVLRNVLLLGSRIVTDKEFFYVIHALFLASERGEGFLVRLPLPYTYYQLQTLCLCSIVTSTRPRSRDLVK